MHNTQSEQRGNLLIIDDEPEVLQALKRLFRKTYAVYTANNAAEGEEVLCEHSIQVIISDQRMPNMTGTEFFKQIKTEFPDAIRIILTAYTDSEALIDAINDGNVFRYLPKPWKPDEMEAIIQNAFEHYRLIHGKRTLTRDLQAANAQLLDEVEERKRAERELYAYRTHLEELVQRHTTELQQANRELAREIAERRQTNAELHASTERLSVVIETIQDGMTLSNRSGYFEIFNSTMVEITGYTKEEANASGDFLRMLYPDPQQYQEAASRVNEVFRTSGTRDVETAIRAKDGTFKTLSVSTSLIQHRDGEWFLSAYHEITDRKRLEAELRASKEQAEAANQAKSEFLANMSHELRTPLNGILGYAQILRHDKSLTEKQLEGIEIILRSGDHLLTLINDILDLSKIEAGKLEIECAPFSLGGILRSIVEMTRVRAQQKGLDFRYEVMSNDAQMVIGDEKRLRQILLNLLGNAVKFTTQGSVTLRVGKTSEVSETSKVRLRFEVEDTGIGIAPEECSHIFLPFQQARNQHLFSEGTGLGLAISHRLAEKMGSRIFLKSTPGQGSRFWFDIELKTIEREAPAAPNVSAPQIIGLTGGARTILVVDDNEYNRLVLKEMLHLPGLHILEAANGEDAVNIASECHPDLVFMDLIMPVMDGFEATRRIRRIPDLRETPIIAVSAAVFEQARQESVAAGCLDFLTKPIQEQALFEKLQTHLHLTWIYANAAVTPPTPAEIVPPSSAALLQLYHLSRIGDILGLREYLQELDASDGRFAGFVGKIRPLAKELKIVEIERFLEPYLQQGGQL